MSLVGHLRELRNHLVKALLAVAAGTIVGFLWYDHGLLTFFTEPYCALPGELRLQGDGECRLVVLDVFGGVLLRLKIGLLAGVVLSSPFWLYQLWAFITPGLKRNEKRYGIGFVAASTTLFALGAVMAYITLTKGLELLLSLAGDEVAFQLTAPDYLGFVISLLVAFGLSFELPLIAVGLNLVGILSHEALSGARRWIYFLTIVFAAFITPTQDPFTMLAMAVPMCVLFELAIQVARVVDKRRAKREAAEGLAGLDDDEASPSIEAASPLDTTPSSIDEPAHLQR
ncbi:twin-arginine translocase subunit TatC [Modestobacter marinus]|nr:twin-arginine translocase subunit TatC [Modestobacter marinus]GGL77643.1 Sec-independent protein translocase protein TatC [Modestobacter marinus]